MNKRRVVVTGLGLVSPLGNDVETSWKAALSGTSGIQCISSFDASPYASQIAGQVKSFDASTYMDVKETRRTDLFIQYAMAAATQAMSDANLTIGDDLSLRAGVAIGSGIGGLSTIERSAEVLREGGPRKLSPFFIPAIITNMAAGYVSIRFNLKGPSVSAVSACTTAAHNIGLAARMIAYGDADIMLAGGSEMATCHLGVSGFSAMRALSTRNDEPEKASRPWDKHRDGFVLADGAGILVLEEYEQAKTRGATIYAELAGFGMSSDAYHITAPSPEGGAQAMRLAIHDAGLKPTDIQYVNAHSTSTKLGDESEVAAIKHVFGEHAYQLMVSSTKSMTGHLLGAAGAIEAIFSILSMRDQIVAPTINFDEPDEGCDLNFVPNVAQSSLIDVCISNSFGFGGTNGCLLFRKQITEDR